jgi:uncharacterized protein (TIGR00730 family)
MMSKAQSAGDSNRMVSLADEEAVRQLLSTSIMGLWDVVNTLTRLRPARRDRYRVAIFGSARAQPGSFVYDEVKRVAAAVAGRGCDIVTGGGPGLMQAANEGAASAGAAGSVGIRVELPFEQGANPFVDQSFEHGTFFTRLHHFVIASDAFVVVPGGIGTVLETLMVWQLLQVRHVDQVPLILVGKMWRGLVEWASASMLDPRLPLANADDLKIPVCVDTADEAIALVSDLHATWQAAQITAR